MHGFARMVGVVAIGRNEGERLVRCLRSVVAEDTIVVYVDSGSTDGSAGAARALGADVVELDMDIPFTAARARNTGFQRLMALRPDLEILQFVDGDCEVRADWLRQARDMLQSRSDLAAVCGRRRERFPEASIYNSLCDMEWNTPVGDAQACGGDVLLRVAAFSQVGGYNPGLIAGEEPEMCLRLRRAGWRILRMDAEMTLHDAAMNRFSQWWRRAVRAGHAYAEGADLHGASPERFWVREVRSNWFWGLALPSLALLLAVPTRGISLVLWLLAMLDLVRRMRRDKLRNGYTATEAGRYAYFTALGKFAQASGQLRYWFGRSTGKRSRLIEYKG